MPKEIAQSMPATNDQCAEQKEQISQARPIELGILTDADESKEDKPSAAPGDNSPNSAPNPRHLEGWRLYTLIFGQATFPLLRISTNIICPDCVSAFSFQLSKQPLSAHRSAP